MDKMATFIDIFSVLPEPEFAVAETLYQTGESLHCKIAFKKRTLKDKSDSYRIVFNKHRNNKILFWMEISDGTLLVKADLPLEITDDYADKIAAQSAKIKESITSVKQCVRCSPNGCGGPHVIYYVENKKYMPCVTSGHYFSQMDKSDWKLLRELLIQKNDID